MNSDFNGVLSGIRERILGDMETGDGGLQEATVDRLGGKPGTGGATNRNGVLADFDRYIADIISAIRVEYDFDAESAMSFVSAAIDEAVRQGLLFNLPQEGDAKGLALWIGRAAGVGLGGMSLALARSAAGVGA